LSGNIRGVVLTSSHEPAKDIRVRFVMSDDASVITTTDHEGRFEIRCVYPATGYQICLGSEDAEQSNHEGSERIGHTSRPERRRTFR
jgi:hypothetical protein